jgi:hypothetical protein
VTIEHIMPPTPIESKRAMIITTTSRPPSSVTTTSSAFVDFLSAQFRVAELRARIVTNEIRAMATALSAGLVTPETALLHLHQSGALGLLPSSGAA